MILQKLKYHDTTNQIHRITGIRKEAMIVLFYELPAENVAEGGVMLSEKFKGMESKG
jgi:phenylpyruvate tautomerase PptA (4-oxalocrotonate tautomerase family)